jgi:hypothetical protein
VHVATSFEVEIESFVKYSSCSRKLRFAPLILMLLVTNRMRHIKAKQMENILYANMKIFLFIHYFGELIIFSANIE